MFSRLIVFRQRLLGVAFAPVDIASLVWFRIVFGLLMMVEALRYIGKGRIWSYYLEPEFHFKYYGFSWVEPWSEWGMHLHFWGLAVCGLGIALGLFYRVCASLFFLGFTYVFLLDQSRYLNHHYLVCLFAFLMIWVPAHRALSVDAWMRPRIRSSMAPTWALWLLRAQMLIVYGLAGIAKLNADWLAGEPVRSWLLRRTDYAVLGPYFAEPWMAYVVSYSGLIFDLAVVPLLIWKRTRGLAFSLAILFNLTNSWLFDIGIFPWVTLGATILLFQPRLPHFFPTLWSAPHQGVQNEVRSGLGKNWIVGCVAMYLLLQILIPFRYLLYPGDVAWTEQGHRFSWRMMLRSKSGDLSLHVHDPSTGESRPLQPLDYLTASQYYKAKTRPDMILQLCHHVAEDMRAHGHSHVEVRALVWVSLNGRKPQLLVDPEVDLAAEPRTLGNATWITSLSH